MDVKQKILIVDDEQINLDFFDVMLTKLGFQVEKAEDGEEALEKVVSYQPDLIILDNIMPKMSGWEVTRTLKQDEEFNDFRSTPIIMFSAMDEVKDKIEGFELGVEDYITKPFNFSEVLARIRAVLRNHELSRQIVRRERHIALIESLNKSLIYFTEHLREPVLGLLTAARDIETDDRNAMDAFVRKVIDESEKTLAALGGLEDEIKELQSRGNELRAGELALRDLEDKFQKNIQSWKTRQGRMGEAHS